MFLPWDVIAQRYEIDFDAACPNLDREWGVTSQRSDRKEEVRFCKFSVFTVFDEGISTYLTDKCRCVENSLDMFEPPTALQPGQECVHRRVLQLTHCKHKTKYSISDIKDDMRTSNFSISIKSTITRSCNMSGRCRTRPDLRDHRTQAERTQVRDPLWIWNQWRRTHEAQNRSNRWLHKMGLGPNKYVF